MANYDTTATCQETTQIKQAVPNTALNGGFAVASAAAANVRAIANFLLPQQPYGADRINRTTLVVTYANAAGSGNTARSYQAQSISQKWTQGSATWNTFAGVGSAWGTAGGDKDKLITVTNVGSPAYGASSVFDITAVGLTWNGHGSVLVQDASEDGAVLTKIYQGLTVATVTWRPHIVVNFADDPPPALVDLKVIPDATLTEATALYKQRAYLTWSVSNANDFKRYRIRRTGSGYTPGLMTTAAFINSRASTTWLDQTAPGNYNAYAIYVEDYRNGSTSTSLGATYTNVSNVASYPLSAACIIGSVIPSSSASTLDSVEVRVRPPSGVAISDARKAKIFWGDGAYSFTQNLTSAGGYFYARHRYTKATTVRIRAETEDLNGFRSLAVSYSTGYTISNLGPVAKIVASPSRQRTGSTFSFGDFVGSQTIGAVNLMLNTVATYTCISDAVGLSATIKNSSASTYRFYQMRLEGDRYRIVDTADISTSTGAGQIRRNINWRMRLGDNVAVLWKSGNTAATLLGSYRFAASTSDASYTIGSSIPKYRFGRLSRTPTFKISYAATNPVSISAKDSFARGSNRSINRFRWAPNYAGDFGAAYATGGSYTTGATSSFYWAWTTATTQFVAVRAVDDTNASSIDVAGVVIETESTFRIPDNLQHVAVHLSEKRPRAYTHSPALSRDYGTVDLGALEPWTINVRGRSFMSTATNNFYGDISNLQAAFQQRWRIYVRAPATTSSYVQGYLVDVPFVQDTNEPTVKVWDATVVVAT